MLLIKYLCRLTLLVFLLLIIAGCTIQKRVHRVLVIHSYEASHVSYADFNQMIKSEFYKQGIEAEFFIFYLDCESFSALGEIDRMDVFLNSIASWKPEVIIVNEDQATYSLLQCNNALAKKTPIVFAGVNYPDWELIKQYPNVTGFEDKIDFKANIGVAKELFGDKVSLFTILDRTFLDRQIRADVDTQLTGEKVFGLVNPATASERNKLCEEGYTYFYSIPVRDSKDGNGLLWSLSKYTSNNCYLQLKRDFTTGNVGNVSSSPSLTAINEVFGYNEKLLGGYFTSLPVQVAEQVGAAARILRGIRPMDIPITRSKKEYILDWNVMQMLNLSKKDVPSKYKIIHMPFRVAHWGLWIGIIVSLGTVVVVLFTSLIFLYRREYKRKRNALYALEDEKETLALAIEGSNTFALKLQDDCFILEDTFWKSLGLPVRKIPLEQAVQIVHPDYRKQLAYYWRNIYEAKKVAVQLLCDFDGKGYHWWELRYSTTVLPHGGTRTAGLLLDIQGVKDREQELEESRRLAEKAELKQSFLANMSHEIRTPLNAIVGFSNILAVSEDMEEEEKMEYVDTINRNSELLLQLINDILELSRLESGHMSFEFEDCSVTDLVNDVYSTHRVLIPSCLQFLQEMDEMSPIIHVDKGRLTQVITNFLNNAGKFTESGYIKLGYRWLSETNEVSIFVEDSGRGIAAEEQKMIFGRFYKEDEFAQGTGLGLSICQIIIEKLSGRVELRSELGVGSCFAVVLPCRT